MSRIHRNRKLICVARAWGRDKWEKVPTGHVVVTSWDDENILDLVVLKDTEFYT